MNLKERAREFAQLAKLNIERDGYLVPAAILICPDGDRVVGLRFHDGEEKADAYENLSRLAKVSGATAIISINDCRFKVLAPEEDANYRHGEISENPDNPEAVVVSVNSVTEEPFAILCYYHREGQAKIVFDKEDEIVGAMAGRLFDLLEPPTVH